MKIAISLLLWALPVLAQPPPDLAVTGQVLSKASTSAMFGRLPKRIGAVAVQVCNQRSEPVTAPLARLQQQLAATEGITLLPRDAAIAVIGTAEGGTWQSRTGRAGIAFVGIVSGLTTSRAISVGPAMGSALAGVAAAGAIILPYFLNAAHDYAYLAFDHEALPTMIELQPMGCATGIAMIERDPKARQISFGVSFPGGGK